MKRKYLLLRNLWQNLFSVKHQKGFLRQIFSDFKGQFFKLLKAVMSAVLHENSNRSVKNLHTCVNDGRKSNENSKFNKIGELGVGDEWYSDIRIFIKFSGYVLTLSCQCRCGVLDQIKFTFQTKKLFLSTRHGVCVYTETDPSF